MRLTVVAVVLAAAVAASAVHASPRGVPVTRDCRSSVYGGLGDWQPRSVVVGAVGFVGARGYASNFVPLPAGGGRYRGAKLLAVVRTGWVVRLVVPADDRHEVALQFARADFNKPVVPAESEHDVTFKACPPGRPLLGPKSARWTQFNGAIVVVEPRCVTLDVYAAKRGDPLPQSPARAVLSFGTEGCRG